ncbi:hypothetical protein J5X84_34325 [Streptosporangiaceae bacterium NEAU-GS5]|nr:hypothetical protein [Streptosporangiaceae bacterium NEAU-GS5]
MRVHTLIITLAVAAVAAVAIALAGPARAAAGCIVELDSIYAGNVDEGSGVDEIRVEVDGQSYPRISRKWTEMFAGAIGYASQFEDPSVILDVDHSTVTFGLREVTPPAASSGDSLGGATVSYASDCAGLPPGANVKRALTVSGIGETSYSYLVHLQLTRF